MSGQSAPHPPLSKTTPSFTSTGCPAQPWAGQVGYSRGRILKGRYIGWMLICWLTFTTVSYGMGQGKGGGKRVWAIRLMKEGNRVNGWVLRQMSLKGEASDSSTERRRRSLPGYTVVGLYTYKFPISGPMTCISCLKMSRSSTITQNSLVLPTDCKWSENFQ